MFEMTLEPRFAETDLLGHISNTVFPVWFEAARTPVFKLVHPEMSTHDWPLILARTEIDYLAQTYIGKPVVILTGIGRIGNASFDVLHEARQGGAPVARGKVVMVNFNYQTGRTEPLTDDVKSRLKDATIDENRLADFSS